MNVGYKDEHYASKRNILNIVPDAHYVKVDDFSRMIRWASRLASKVLRRRIIDTDDLAFSFTDFDTSRVDLLHFFNAVSYGTTPWITTFETILPRFKCARSCHLGRTGDFSPLVHETKILKALEALSSDSCKQLIAMSECNLRMQRDFVRLFPAYRSEIERKLICLHPPQRTIVDEYEAKKIPSDGKIRFMFVGRAFFTKGGIELLDSLGEARREGSHDLKLIIISSLITDDYATKRTQDDVARVKKRIQENGDWVEYRERLDNSQVLELMKTAHVGLLPTYADTYGYSVLEFQAAGCPVISTNVRALPEINNNERGWVIDVPKNRLGEAIYTTEEDRAKVSSAIKSGLASALVEIMHDRQIVCRKGDASIRYIRESHSPEDFARRLGAIYRRALNHDGDS